MTISILLSPWQFRFNAFDNEAIDIRDNVY